MKGAKIEELLSPYLEAGDQDAQFYMAFCFDEGVGVEKDSAAGVSWLKKAAEQGHSPALNTLGFCYLNGEGIEKDAKAAVDCYFKAQELAASQHNLGWCYGNGKGLEKDYKLSVEWYRKAAAQGYHDSQCALAGCYKR